MNARFTDEVKSSIKNRGLTGEDEKPTEAIQI